MSKNALLAIDQGTTGTTVLVLDAAGGVLGRSYGECPPAYPRPGRVEHDPDGIRRGVDELIPAALADAGVDAARLAGVGITNQRETVVCWDRKTGEALAPAIVWQDRRTASMCAALQRDGAEARIQQRTGLLLDPYFSATKLRWLLENHDAVRRRAERGELAVGTVDSFLVWHLTGGLAHVTDYTNASRTMLFDIRRLDWDDELLELFRVPRSALPRPVPSASVVGEARIDGARVPIAGLAGDQQAAMFGQACFEPGSVKNTYGTGSFVLLNTGAQPASSRHRLLATVAWGLPNGSVTYALEGAIFVTGAAVQWLRDGLGLIASAAETEALARSVDDNGGVYFVPALAGLGAPHWDPHARGLLIGMTGGTGRGHVVRATLESMAQQSVDVLEAMTADAELPLAELRADGGAVGNAFLMQAQADLADAPVAVPEVTETTALGAAQLAGLATGIYASLDEIAGQ